MEDVSIFLFNRTAMGRARFLLCTDLLFFVVFVFFVGVQTQTSPWPSHNRDFKLKIALDKVNLGLFYSCDYFASPLLVVQTD